MQKSLSDSCILEGDGVIKSGSELADKFVTNTQKGKNSSLKIIHPRANGYTTITKVIYDGKDYYGIVYNAENSFTDKDNYCYELKYKHLKIFELSGYKFVYLLEDNNVTFNDINKYMMTEYSLNAKISNAQLHFYSLCTFDRK